MWRTFQFNKHLLNPGHPRSKFGSGNRDNLSKVGREPKAKGLLSSNGTSTLLSAIIRSGGSSLVAIPESSRLPSPAPSSTSANSEMDADEGSVQRKMRRRLVEWLSKGCCAGRMRLRVIGKGEARSTLRVGSVTHMPRIAVTCIYPVVPWISVSLLDYFVEGISQTI